MKILNIAIFKRLKCYIIRKEFERRFKYFNHPFERADMQVNNLKPIERRLYYLAIHNWINSKAFKIEMGEMIRTFYAELSLKAIKEPEFSAYRMTLLFIKRFQARLTILAKKAEIENSIESTTNSLTNKER